LTASKAARPAAPQRAPGTDRTDLLAFVGLLAAVNGCGAFLLTELDRADPVSFLLELGGIHPIIWFALFAAARIAFEPEAARPVRAIDLSAAILAVLLAFLPVVSAGSLGLFVAGTALGLGAPSGSRGRRVAIVLVALSGTLLWGRLAILLFGPPSLAIDAHFVAWLAGTRASGNLVWFAGSAQPFVIGMPCSSLHGMTLAILLWASLTQLLRLRITPALALVCLASMAGLFLINALRLATIALDPDRFDYWHAGTGGALFGWAGLFAAALIIGGGCHYVARRGLA
jgi:hypothetical protein